MNFLNIFRPKQRSRNTLWIKRIPNSVQIQEDQKNDRGHVSHFSLKTQFSTVQIYEKSFWTISALKAPEGQV